MTEVYGFDDSKSKVQIVDKESQSTKDAEQDASITGKGISDIVATLDGDNLAVTVKQADGTSKSGSVTLPKGGEIEVEDLGVPPVSATVTFPSSVTLTQNGSSSTTFYIMKLTSTGESETALYYDGFDNCLKKCSVDNFTLGYSGTLKPTYYMGSIAGTDTETKLKAGLDSFLLGMKTSLKSNGTTSTTLLYVKVGNYVVLQTTLTLTDDVVTAYTVNSAYITSTSRTLSGSQTVSVAYYNSSVYRYPASAIPSTYHKIADL